MDSFRNKPPFSSNSNFICLTRIPLATQETPSGLCLTFPMAECCLYPLCTQTWIEMAKAQSLGPRAQGYSSNCWK